MKTKFSVILTLLLAFVVQISFAQEKKVSGTVSDDNGLPLPGSTIIIKGSTSGVSTDFDGNYSINANVGDVLTFNYVGYADQNKTVGSANVINVTMLADTSLEEVIVIGYGSTTKEQFVGAAAKVETENITAKANGNFSQALRGEVSGVQVTTGSGAPGSDATIRIRGTGSVNGNRSPLYVVDGAPYASDISAINPADIADITILKDGAATSIYGSRGSNGVILVTTKKGKSGTSNISVDVRTSINSLMLPQYSVITSPEEYIETTYSSLVNKGRIQGEPNPNGWASDNLYGTVEGINSAYNIWDVPGNQLINQSTGRFNEGINRRWTPTLWSDAAFGTGVRQEANIQFDGGDEKTQYAASFGYLDDEGFVTNSGYTRYTTRINLQHKPKEWLRVGANMAFTGAQYNRSSGSEGSTGSSGNIFALTSTTPSIYDVFLRDTEGNLIADPIFGGNQYDYGNDYGRRAWNATNGIADSKYDVSRTNSITLLGNFNLGIDFTDWLSLDIRYSGQFGDTDSASRGNPYYGGNAGSGFLSKSLSQNVNQNWNQILRFNTNVGELNIDGILGHESNENRFKNMNAAAQNAILPNNLDLDQYTIPFGRAGSYSTAYTLESWFAVLNLSYDGKYFLSSSARRDGSSRFIKNKWGTFGSVGLGWVMSKEDFFPKDSFVDYFKVNGSFGINGDQGNNLQYGWQIFGINQTPDGSYSFTQSSTLANRDLTWEEREKSNIGFETILFDGKVTLDMDYFSDKTKNMFFNQTLPGSSGSTLIQYNDGVLANRGLEFNTNINLIQTEDFSMSLNVNGAMLTNELEEMPTDYFTGDPKVLDGRYSAGKSLYDWYMREWAGVNPATGTAMWNLYYDDMNNDGIFDSGDSAINSMTLYMDEFPDANVQKTSTETYSDATQKYVGKNNQPDIAGGFRLNAAYKNFDISAQFTYSIGGYIYDNGYATIMQNRSLAGSDNFHTDARNAWKQPGDITNVPRLSAGYSTDVQHNSYSTRFLTKADYLSLNNVRLGYALPKDAVSKAKLENVSFYVSGDNLMMLSARKGLNPQTLISSSGSGIYMPMTTFSIGTKIQF
ncbi:SusC/RagA family TonB-linked outer membrane protein [Flavobacteriaceae bacterium]|nr:SusC/RagA family TonB-linked outer membrane protein [Flavobacteriaceae bacterium]